MKEIVLSGIRATGRLHFGNFYGAVRHFVEYQKDENIGLYFIADWHTLTTNADPDELRGNLLEIAKDYLAAGLDPHYSHIYAQSSIPEISELCLYLCMLQSLGDLQRIPTFKEMIRKSPDEVNAGKLLYPVLMAADILGPKATLVPVGNDQIPNVELARNLAKVFNERFGQTLAVPAFIDNMVKVPGLDGEKMGKSDSRNAIDIRAPIAEIRDLYKRHGVTDEKRCFRSQPGHPFECKSVYPLHEMLTPGEKETRIIAKGCQSAELGCADCKNLLVDQIAVRLEPFQQKRRELAEKDALVKEVLHEGGKKARAMVVETIIAVREKMGIVIY